MRSTSATALRWLSRGAEPRQLGTIIRLADWFGIGDIVCSEGSADCFNPKVVQATMGAILRVRIHYAPLTPLLAGAAARGVAVYGTFLDGEDIYSADLTPGGIVVMGNEGRGVTDAVARTVTRRLFIPVSGRKGGLRIAQCRHGDGHRLLGVPPASAQLTARRTGTRPAHRNAEAPGDRRLRTFFAQFAVQTVCTF